MPEITANSRLLSKTKVHVDDTGGTGRPVVLIHGWPLSGESWSEQTPALSDAGYRVIAYDRRGFGRSDKPRGGYDYDTLAEDLEGVLDELDLRAAGDELKVTESQRHDAIALCQQSDQRAALDCMEAFATTDFREDLTKVAVPTLVLHGSADATVPFEGSGKRTHEAIAGSELAVVDDAPHGFNVSHAQEFNAALLRFLSR